MKSLLLRGHELSNADAQLEILRKPLHGLSPSFSTFGWQTATLGFNPLLPQKLSVLQVNLGKMCNQTCRHCHVDAGPDRKEIMSAVTIRLCLDLLRTCPFDTLDLTGGAPEMNPHFRDMVVEARRIRPDIKIIVRCNLTILVANPKYKDLPYFFGQNEVEVISSLPFYSASRTDAQRGDGVFRDSIRALYLLNEAGYGKDNSNLQLHLVYNPAGAFLPASQVELEREFKRVLQEQHGILFNHLYCITNMPISRFLEYLLASGNYETYMEKLINAFNPNTIDGLMCRNTLSVAWEGSLYHCDFNQMLELNPDESIGHLSNFNWDEWHKLPIITDQHCYGCTAGTGSSCVGNIER